MPPAELLHLAVAARSLAYAPYSQFQVGCALLCADGSIFTGCNVENSSYGLTLCAERNALTTAVAAGKRHFTALAIALAGGGPPCGACRQMLAEFCPDLTIFLGDESGQLLSQTTLHTLFPTPFRLS